MSENFSVERTTIKALFANYALSIPPFQRRFVWSNDKKCDLIDSLSRSFPIGVITLFLNKENDHYLIVDGLQRINTIKSYLSNPSAIVPFKLFYDGIAGKMKDLAEEYGLNERNIKKSVKKWYENLNTEEGESEEYEAKEYKYKDFSHLKECLEEFGLHAVTNDFGLFQSFRNILLKPINIEDEMIALIKYKGESDELPELFTKINQKTVSLTGYEILHSLWYDYKIPTTTFPGFEIYVEAFKRLIGKSKGYVPLEDYDYDDSFNMYMNISSLEQIIEEKTDDEVKEYFLSKNTFRVLKSETVFDAFSTICQKTTNRINKSVKDIFEGHVNVAYDFILSLNQAIISTSLYLNKLFCEEKIEPYSKYFYIYFFYYVFFKRYDCNPQKGICKEKTSPGIVKEEMLSRIKKAQEERWFKDENRQLGFFTWKIRELDESLGGDLGVDY